MISVDLTASQNFLEQIRIGGAISRSTYQAGDKILPSGIYATTDFNLQLAYYYENWIDASVGPVFRLIDSYHSLPVMMVNQVSMTLLKERDQRLVLKVASGLI